MGTLRFRFLHGMRFCSLSIPLRPPFFTSRQRKLWDAMLFCLPYLLVVLLHLERCNALWVPTAGSSSPPPPSDGTSSSSDHTGSSIDLQSSSFIDVDAAESVRRKLESLHSLAVKTIQGPYGDIIDCVPLEKQPAMDHPMLKSHKIKTQPSARPLQVRGKERQTWKEEETIWQAWRASGTESCPEGSIAIRRTSIDVSRASSLDSFGRKSRAYLQRLQTSPARREGTSPTGHDHAIAYVSGGEYHGASATINVWDPSVESPSDFSLSQMWILSGSFQRDLNTIEAGWQVSPELYGDGRPRFFIYWTADAYQQTGCYNLLCAGFVQTTSKVAMGAAISPWSSFKGAQYDIKILIWKDPQTGDWWMEFGDSTLVGYWPAKLFTHLGNKATVVEWGGEVARRAVPGSLKRHTSTHMGSGRFAGEGFARASYFRDIEVVTPQNQLQTISKLATSADHPTCYNILISYNSNWGNHFYYGGPGRNPACP